MRKRRIVEKTNKEKMVVFGSMILEIIAPFLNRGADVLHKINHSTKRRFSSNHHTDISQHN